MGGAIIAAIVIGGSVGAFSGAYFLYLISEPARWNAFVARFLPIIDNRLTRWVFENSIGAAVNLKCIEEFIAKGDFARAADLAVSEGFVDEAVHAFEKAGVPLEGARLARRIGDEVLAADLFSAAIDRFDAEANSVAAAEAADEAGFAEEAVRRFEAFGGAASCLRAARIASAAGMAEKAVALFLVNEDFLNAARTAEKHGLDGLVFDLCDKSDNPALHMFGAEAAARQGKVDLGLGILEGHGHLHQAAQFAKERGRPEKVEEIIEKIRAAKADRARRLYEGGFGNFGGDPGAGLAVPESVKKRRSEDG